MPRKKGSTATRPLPSIPARSAAMDQPWGTNKAKRSATLVAPAAPPVKALKMPTMPVMVKPTPKTMPTCLSVLSSEMRKMPMLVATRAVPRMVKATSGSAPQRMLKIRRPQASRTIICTSTVRPVARYLPPSTVGMVTGVVNRRWRVPCSCSVMMVWAEVAPV